MAASVVLWLLACSHCSIVFVAQYHGSRNRPAANRSMVMSSDGAAVSGFKPGSSKLSDADGFDPNALTITSPGGFNPNSFSVSTSEYSVTDGFIRSSSRISNLGGFKISRPDGSVTDGFNPSSSEISSPNTVSPKVFKISNPSDSTDNGFIPHGSKTTESDISALNGSGTSNPNKISRPNGINIQDISGPAAVSQTSNVPSSSAPNVRDRSNATNIYKCYDDFTEDQLSFVLPLRLELFLILFLLPFAVTVFCYINFVRVLLARPNIPLEKKQRAVGLAVATMVNFGVCFAPYNISHVVGFVEKRSPNWRVYALLLTSLNAALDPLVFYFSSTAVRKGVAGVAAAVQDKLRVVGGWCWGACSLEASKAESEGSLT